MCKKIGVMALVVVAGLAVLHKLDVLPYFKLAWRDAKASVQKQIKPETKLQLLRDEIAKLGPAERGARSEIAREMVEVNKLKDQIATLRTNLDKREVAIKELRSELEKGSAFVTTDGTKLPRAKVEDSLRRQWTTFKGAQEGLKSQEDLLRSKEEALEVAKAKYDTMVE